MPPSGRFTSSSSLTCCSCCGPSPIARRAPLPLYSMHECMGKLRMSRCVGPGFGLGVAPRAPLSFSLPSAERASVWPLVRYSLARSTLHTLEAGKAINAHRVMQLSPNEYDSHPSRSRLPLATTTTGPPLAEPVPPRGRSSGAFQKHQHAAFKQKLENAVDK